jgi:hypothetical protein
MKDDLRAIGIRMMAMVVVVGIITVSLVECDRHEKQLITDCLRAGRAPAECGMATRSCP